MLIDKLEEMEQEFAAQVEMLVDDKMDLVHTVDLGIDRRASPMLHVSEDAIAVHKRCDRLLQYYGGFEYVNEDHRKVLGDYVFYLADDERVAGHLASYYQPDREQAGEQ